MVVPGLNLHRSFIPYAVYVVKPLFPLGELGGDPARGVLKTQFHQGSSRCTASWDPATPPLTLASLKAGERGVSLSLDLEIEVDF